MAAQVCGDEMPVIEIEKNYLIKLCGIPEDELREVLTLVKAPIDEEEGDMWKLEITPDRPDMFSAEGIARSVKGFLGMETGMPSYPAEETEIEVKASEVKARPYIACAAVLNVEITPWLFISLIQLQEKIHETIGRRRKKVAIGVHDLDKISPPFEYREVKPDEIAFVPLDKSEVMSLGEILEKHEKGKEYRHILEGCERYPVILDKYGEIVSFPPIINAERTRVTDRTKNLFIEVTGTDERAVNHVLNILVSNLCEVTGKIGKVKVNGRIFPDFSVEEREISVEEVDRLLGLGLKEHEIAQILRRMRYSAMEMKGGKIKVFVPFYRVDILHPVDVIEDVLIGYGINNLTPLLPKIPTPGKKHGKEKLCEKIREIMIGLGFQEVLTFMLSNKERMYAKMNLKWEEREGKVVEIENPMSREYTACRTWLLPNLMEFLSENTHRKYPQRIFEVGDCIRVNEQSETSAEAVLKLACAIAHDRANLTEIKSVAEAVARELNASMVVKPFEHGSFIPSRCGEIYLNGKRCGIFGEIHPAVLENWKIEKPVIAMEIEVEQFV